MLCSNVNALRRAGSRVKNKVGNNPPGLLQPSSTICILRRMASNLEFVLTRVTFTAVQIIADRAIHHGRLTD